MTVSAAATVLGAMMLAGCAVDDQGFVDTRWYTNDTAWVVSLRAWGAHVITNSADAGITIGRTEKLYCFARRDAEHADSSAADALLSAMHDGRALLREAAAHPKLSDLGEPVALSCRDAGVLFRCSAHDVGLTIGVRNHAALRLPTDADGVLVLAIDPDVPESTQFYWKGAMP